MPSDAKKWGAAFFGYVPAYQAYGDDAAVALQEIREGAAPSRARRHLKEAAQMFLDANPECPFDADWLAADFTVREKRRR